MFSRNGCDILFSPYGSFQHICEDEVAHLLRSVADQCVLSDVVVDIGERISRMVNNSVVWSGVGGRCAWRDDFLHELDKSIELTDGFNLADLYPTCEEDLLDVL